MSEVQKYESEVGLMKESGVGQYVKLYDYRTLQAKIDQLTKEQEELKVEIDRLQQYNDAAILTKERDLLKAKLLTSESGFGESSEAWRYRKIHHAVDQMGGFANFSEWVNYHAKEYFCTVQNLDGKLDIAVKALELLRRDYSLWKVPRAGGQDKYAALPPAMRVIDAALVKINAK